MLVAEALAHGDMGLALLILRLAVASALTHWGSAISRPPISKSSPARTFRRPAWHTERSHYSTTRLKTTAVRTLSGYRPDGVKSLIPWPPPTPSCLLSAQLGGKPRTVHCRVCGWA